MENRKENEMEQIQRGLEEFLEKELGHEAEKESGRGRSDTGGQASSERSYRQEEGGNTRGKNGRGQDRYDGGNWDDNTPEYIKGSPKDYESEYIRRDLGESEYIPREADDPDIPFRAEEEYDEAGWEENETEEGIYDWDSEPVQRTGGGKRISDYESLGHEGEARRQASAHRAGSQRQDVQSRSASRRRDPDRYEEAGRERGRKPPENRKASGRPAQNRREETQMAKKPPKSQKKKRKKKRRLLKFLITVAVILGLLGIGLYQLVGVVYGKMTYHEIASVAEAPMKEDGVVNILLIGNDSRVNGEDGRSDAMILLSISSRTKKIYMTSLLRDIYVDIPGHEGNRLNAAYSFGGAELLMETIEKNLDISVNRYILVNFEAFAGLVDAVGGIELELSKEEKEYVNGYLVEYNILTDRPQGTDNIDASESGPVHLNGPQALAYSRNRYLGTDFGRTDRQRKVLTAVIGRLPSALVTNPGGLMDGLLPNLTTNLTRGECFRLSLMAGNMLTYDIESDSIPQPGTYQNVTIRKMEVLEVDFEKNISYLREKLYGE